MVALKACSILTTPKKSPLLLRFAAIIACAIKGVNRANVSAHVRRDFSDPEARGGMICT